MFYFSSDIGKEELNADDVTIIDKKVKILDSATNKEVECLTRNIYHEARNEPTLGQEAVAAVTINRLKSGKYGNSICKVVYHPYAFSWTLDESKQTGKLKENEAKEKAKSIAIKAIQGDLEDPTNGATHYHATYVNPKWNRHLEKKVKISNHIFYE